MEEQEQEQSNKKQYDGPPIVKESKRKDYTSHLQELEGEKPVNVYEATTIKTMFLSGANRSQIAKTMQRSLQTISRVIDNFERYLPEDETLQEKFNAHMEEVVDTLIGRSKAIVDKMDEVVYQRGDNENVGPLEAAKISKMYQERLGHLLGEDKLKGSKAQQPDHDEAKMQNILQNVFNVNINMNKDQDDRYRKTPKAAGTDPNAADGEQEADTEGAS